MDLKVDGCVSLAFIQSVACAANSLKVFKVHNSECTEAEYYQHAKTDEEKACMKKKLAEGRRADGKPPDTLRRFEANEAVWFCESCKFPPCVSGLAGEQCAGTRSASAGSARTKRFLLWTCSKSKLKKTT